MCVPMPRFVLFLLIGSACLAISGMLLAVWMQHPHPAGTLGGSSVPQVHGTEAGSKPPNITPRLGVDPLNFGTPIAQPTSAVDAATRAAIAGKPTPPTALTGFWTMPESQQVAVVTAMEGDATWPMSVRIFLREAVQDRSLAPITRNNIANGLIRQRPADTTLDRLFAHMAVDPLEGPVWRDYAVQFLAQTFDTTLDRKQVEADLFGFLTHGVGSQPATVALHLHHLDHTGKIHLGPDFTQKVVEIASTPTQSEGNRTTALALLAERQAPEGLPLARLAIIDPSPGLRRVGAGSLGIMGVADDLSLLKAASSDHDASVARAASKAMETLAKRIAANRQAQDPVHKD